MALTMARCSTSLRTGSASRRAQVQARPCRPVSFVRFARPSFARPSAYRYGGCYGDSAAMKDMYNEMARQWQQGNISGGIYWPGGGYVFKNGRWSTAGPNQTSSKAGSASSAPSLPLDVVSAGDFYLLYADVPGLAKSDLSIKLSGPNKEPRVIKISGQRTNPFQQQQQQQKEGDNKAADASSNSSDSVVQQQRVFGSLSTSWELPADADSEGISAKVTDGVLTVTVPKKQQPPPQPEPEEEEGQDIFVA